MLSRTHSSTGLPLPKDLAELDAELLSLTLDERPSFGPELQAELENAWRASSVVVKPRFRVNHAMAAAIGALLLVGLAAPQARAGLARVLPWSQPTEAEPVPEQPVTQPAPILPDETPIVFALGEAPPPEAEAPPIVPDVSSEEIRFDVLDNSYPKLLDRAAAERTIRNQYPIQLQEAGIGGLVTLRLWVAEDGTVDQAQIERGSGVSEFDRVALDMAPSFRFEPARRAGVTVGTWVNFDVAFEPAEGSPSPVAPSPIATPAPPINVGEFSEELFPGEYLTPPPTAFEGQELLRTALGDAIEKGGPFDNLPALLKGDAPAGVGLTQWRRQAGILLQNAMRSSPQNPAPALALARLRRKQGLRDEARRLYADAVYRAASDGLLVTRGFLAELFYEQGTIIQEQWLAWEGLGRIEMSELNDIDCPVRSVGIDGRYASAQHLIGLNNVCPAEFRTAMSEDFKTIDPPKGESREIVRRSLSAAVDAVPSHPGANIELLLDLADEARWSDVLKESQRFIWDSRGNPHGILLSGLALQRLGYPEEAMDRFRIALDALPVGEANSLRDIGVLLPPSRVSAYAALSDADRAEMEKAFWSTRDPILTTTVNEREAEHYARATYASLRFGDLDSEPAEVLIRYGAPSAIRSVGVGGDMRTVFWDFGGGSHVTFGRSATSRQMDLTPESVAYLQSLREVFPDRYGSSALREVRELSGSVSQFRLARGGLEIEIHSEVPNKMFGGPSDSLHVSVFLLGEDDGVLSSTRQLVAAAPGALDLRTWAGPEVRRVVLEVYDDDLGFVAALREPVGLDAVEGGEPMISDLLLVEARDPEPSQVRRTAAWVRPLPQDVASETTLGVIFELYDLPEGDESSSYTLQAHLEAADGSVIPLYLCPSGAHEFRTSWRRKADATVGVADYVTVDLTEIEPGEYTLEIVATLPRAVDPVRSRRVLTVR